VDDNGYSSTDGTKVQIWDCNGGQAQNWTVGTDGSIRVNGKCLDVSGAGVSNGSPVVLWDCDGAANQQWIPQLGYLYNPVSGRCLDDPGGSTTDGTQLDLWSCNGDGANQQWKLPTS